MTAEQLAMTSRVLRLAGPLGIPLLRKMDKDLWEVRSIELIKKLLKGEAQS